MKGWLIYDYKAAKENKTYIDWFIEEAKIQEVQLQLIFRESLTIGIMNGEYHILLNDKSANLPDFTIIRTIEPTLQTYFEACNVATFNSAKVSHICNNKTLTHLEINKLHIPMVTTYFTNKNTLPEKPPISYPFIVKESTGRSGKQVYYIKNDEEW